jgi:hypothetical protein
MIRLIVVILIVVIVSRITLWIEDYFIFRGLGDFKCDKLNPLIFDADIHSAIHPAGGYLNKITDNLIKKRSVMEILNILSEDPAYKPFIDEMLSKNMRGQNDAVLTAPRTSAAHSEPALNAVRYEIKKHYRRNAS